MPTNKNWIIHFNFTLEMVIRDYVQDHNIFFQMIINNNE